MEADSSQETGVKYPLGLASAGQFKINNFQATASQVAELQRLPLGSNKELQVAILVARQEIMAREGIQSLGVTSNIGRGRLEHILRVAPGTHCPNVGQSQKSILNDIVLTATAVLHRLQYQNLYCF